MSSSAAGHFSDYHLSSFAALEVPVTITPRFAMPAVACLGGRYGPFVVNYPTAVPLWLALYLRQTDTCALQPPACLARAELEEVLRREQASDLSFEPLPFYFYELAQTVCGGGGGSGGGDSGGDRAAEQTEVLRLVQEVGAARRRKLLDNMAVLEAADAPMSVPAVKLTSIVSAELHFLRVSLAPVLQQARRMDQRRTQPRADGAVPPAVHLRTAAGAGGATPSRPSAASEMSDARRSSTAATVTSQGGDGDGDGDAQPLLLSSQGTTMTTATTMATATATAEAETGPVVVPPTKKRRTLRQT